MRSKEHSNGGFRHIYIILVKVYDVAQLMFYYELIYNFSKFLIQ